MTRKVPLPQVIVLTREQKISGLTNIINKLIYLQQSGVIIKDVNKFIKKLRAKIRAYKKMQPRTPRVRTRMAGAATSETARKQLAGKVPVPHKSVRTRRALPLAGTAPWPTPPPRQPWKRP